MTRIAAPISLTGSQFDDVGHICAFLNSDDEEYRVLHPFIKDGSECGDRAVQLGNRGASPSLNELSYEYTDDIRGSSRTPESLKDAIAHIEVRM